MKTSEKSKSELTPDDLGGIDTAASEIKVEEARYPEAIERMTGL